MVVKERFRSNSQYNAHHYTLSDVLKPTDEKAISQRRHRTAGAIYTERQRRVCNVASNISLINCL